MIRPARPAADRVGVAVYCATIDTTSIPGSYGGGMARP
jgi:hypothetical protein